jgi:hypothetical protein
MNRSFLLVALTIIVSLPALGLALGKQHGTTTLILNDTPDARTPIAPPAREVKVLQKTWHYDPYWTDETGGFRCYQGSTP